MLLYSCASANNTYLNMPYLYSSFVIMHFKSGQIFLIQYKFNINVLINEEMLCKFDYWHSKYG